MRFCPKCGKKGTQYFEGILQLRNPNQEVVDFIHKEMAKQEERGIYINKIVELKNGLDLYLTSQRYLQVLAKKIHANFGGLKKTSSQLFTKDKQTSKDLYRVNVFMEIPKFSKGNVLKIDDRVVEVHGFGDKASGLDLKTEKKVLFGYGQNVEILKKHKTTISKKYPKLEVIHPLTFQSVTVQNPKRYKKGESVKVVIFEERLFLV